MAQCNARLLIDGIPSHGCYDTNFLNFLSRNVDFSVLFCLCLKKINAVKKMISISRILSDDFRTLPRKRVRWARTNQTRCWPVLTFVNDKLADINRSNGLGDCPQVHTSIFYLQSLIAFFCWIDLDDMFHQWSFC